MLFLYFITRVFLKLILILIVMVGLVELSRRQEEVFRKIGEGVSNYTIADQLGISYKTVESHYGNLIEKLGLNGTTELVVYVARKIGKKVDADLSGLTFPEWNVFARLGRGDSCGEIAFEISKSVRTVEMHTRRVRKKIGCGSLRELYAIAGAYCDGRHTECPVVNGFANQL